jgi:Big-like domain-containing protein
MLNRWRLVAGLISTFGLVITMAGGSPIVASAESGNGNGNDTKTTICHRTASHTHPYVVNRVDNSSVDGNTGNDNGKGDHFAEHVGPVGPIAEGEWGDIIPPVAGHNGLNWTDAGKAIYDNNCRLPNELWDTGVTTTIYRSNGDALGTPKAGVSVYDTAIVSHYDSGIEPAGKVTYSFFQTGNCTGTSTTHEVTLGSGIAPHSSTKGPLGAGPYSFQASYGGDSNYAGSLSDCEPLTILKADPGISTTQDPVSALVGATLKDSASVTGGYIPTGTVTFVLTLNGETVLTSEPIALDAQGKAAFTTGYLANTAGTYYWIATYNGDPNNNTMTSGATDEPVTVSTTLVPTIVTTPNPKTTTVGATLKDTATIGGIANPNGYIIFTLKYPNGTVAWTKTVTVNGNGSYQTPTGFVANVQGTWHWMAAYYDANDTLVVQSGANDEPVVVGPGGGVLAQTAMTLPAQSLAVGLLAFGLLAMLGAFAWRRREA